MLSNLTKVTQLKGTEARIWTQAGWLQTLSLNPLPQLQAVSIRKDLGSEVGKLRDPQPKAARLHVIPAGIPSPTAPHICSPPEREHLTNSRCGLGQSLALSGPLCPPLNSITGALATLRWSLCPL